MRYSFVAAAIIGAVAAAPEYGYPAGNTPSYDSYPVDSSSAQYPASTPAASSSKPSYDNGYPVASSSVPAYPHESSSKPVVPTSSKGYPVESSSAGYPVYTPSSSQGYPVESSSSIYYGSTSSVPGGCNPAHPGSCPTPSSSKGYPVESSSAGYPVYTPSSSKGYPAESSSAGYPAHTPSSSKGYPVESSSIYYGSTSSVPGGCNPAHPGSCPTPSSSKGYPVESSSKAYPTSTKELTTYTTTTVCPITKTYGTSVVTTLTTSTVTITSCKGGCHHETTVPAKPTSTPAYPTKDTTTVVTTYDWVPCSTEVGHSGSSKIYSTYLTASYKTYTSTIYAPKPTADNKPSYSVGVPQYTPAPVPSQPAGENKPSYSVGIPQYTPAPVPSQPAGETCPPPVTVTKTVTVGVDVPSYTPVAPPKGDEYTTKVITVTENHKPQTYTVTVPNGSKTSSAPYYGSTSSVPGGCNPAHPGSCPTPSSSKGYPTGKPSHGSSIVYSSSAPAPYPTSSVPVKPSSSAHYEASSVPVKPSSSSAGYPEYPVSSAKPSSSSAGYPEYPVSSATPSSSAGYEPYPIPSTTKATPVPTGGYGSGYGY